MATGRDAEMDALTVADDRVHAQPARAGLPLPRVLVVADAGHHLPRVAAVGAAEERSRLDTAEELVLLVAGLDRPDVRQRASVVLRERRCRLRLLERFPPVRRAQDLHAEEGIAA